MLASIIRTLVPYLVAVLGAFAAKYGFDLPLDALTLVVAALVTGAYYVVARFIEYLWPGIGRILLGFGLKAGSPVYARVANGQTRLPRM
ncbi:MAG: hypothetical protein JWN52_7207 [Actinomycetia bacterium]|nr:hypothetical protein [Actinomycetes bacterium]